MLGMYFLSTTTHIIIFLSRRDSKESEGTQLSGIDVGG